MNHPYIASSNAKLVYRQKLDEAANSRRLKALRSGQPRRSFWARLFGRSGSRPVVAPELEPRTEGTAW